MSDEHKPGLFDGKDPDPLLQPPPEPPGQLEVVRALHHHREQLEQLGSALGQAQRQIEWLINQRTSSDLLMERNSRSAALDLAIKALPEAQRDADAIVAYADAFLQWMKGGMH